MRTGNRGSLILAGAPRPAGHEVRREDVEQDRGRAARGEDALDVVGYFDRAAGGIGYAARGRDGRPERNERDQQQFHEAALRARGITARPNPCSSRAGAQKPGVNRRSGPA